MIVAKQNSLNDTRVYTSQAVYASGRRLISKKIRLERKIVPCPDKMNDEIRQKETLLSISRYERKHWGIFSWWNKFDECVYAK